MLLKGTANAKIACADPKSWSPPSACNMPTSPETTRLELDWMAVQKIEAKAPARAHQMGETEDFEKGQPLILQHSTAPGSKSETDANKHDSCVST
jgi:hypothetical protein